MENVGKLLTLRHIPRPYNLKRILVNLLLAAMETEQVKGIGLTQTKRIQALAVCRTAGTTRSVPSHPGAFPRRQN